MKGKKKVSKVTRRAMMEMMSKNELMEIIEKQYRKIKSLQSEVVRTWKDAQKAVDTHNVNR